MPAAAPSASGTAMPTQDTSRAPRARISPTSNSSPTTNMYRTSPTCEIAYSSGIDAAGKTHACASGATSPNNDGPSSTPATISLTTGACPTRVPTIPTTRHAVRMTPI